MASLSNKSNRDKIINDNSDPAKGISLVIPRVFSNVSWRRIKKFFIDLNWGFVERVDIIPAGRGRNYKRAFVHFAPGKWNTRNPEAMKVLDTLRNGSQVKIVYDKPWLWKVSISGAKRPEEMPKPALSGASKNNNNNNNAERKRRRKERANAAQKRLNKTRKQNAGRRKKKKTRRRRRTKKK